MSFVPTLSSASHPSLLVVVLDLESLLVGLRAQQSAYQESGGLDLDFVVQALCVFASSHAFMQRSNRLCVMVFHSFGIEYVYPSKELLCDRTRVVDFSISIHDLHSTISHGLHAIVRDFTAKVGSAPNKSIGERSTLSAALTNAMTIIHRQRELCTLQSRVLVLQFDKDIQQNYNSVMNCIFSANKLDTVIDALVLSNFDSHLMQQACYLTGGIYKKHSDWRDLQLLLQSYFLADKSTRSLLVLPTQPTVDFKASCFCHKSPVDFAYMCSVCLTLHCEPKESCMVCNTPVRSKTIKK